MPDQPDYREKSISKLTGSMACEENHRNSVNIEEDSKSSAETSTYNIPSYKYNDAYIGQRYVTELGGNNDDENNKVNKNENNRPKRLKFNPQVLVTVYDNKSQDDDKYNDETILSKVSVHPSVNTSTDLYKYSDANTLKSLLHTVL